MVEILCTSTRIFSEISFPPPQDDDGVETKKNSVYVALVGINQTKK